MDNLNPNTDPKSSSVKSYCHLSLSIETSSTIQGIKIQIDPDQTETLWKAITDLLESKGYTPNNPTFCTEHTFSFQKDSIVNGEQKSHSRYR